MTKKTILNAVVDRINNTQDRDVFLRKDFLDLGSYAQIGNCLRQLCKDQKLRRFGQGLYARTTVATTPPFEGKVYVKKGLVGMDGIAAEALRRLGYEVVPSRADRDYNDRRSTQVPFPGPAAKPKTCPKCGRHLIGKGDCTCRKRA